jgi:threonyl-tRNA synthetase
LEDSGLRVEVDESGDTVGDKIRTAITQKHPAVIVVGDNDVDAGTVGLRLYGEDKDTRGVPVGDAVSRLTEMAEKPAL